MFKQADLQYSLKNIPIPSKDSFLKCLLSKTESFVQRLRWKSYFFLNPDQKKPTLNTFGFKTEKSAPQVKELINFENAKHCFSTKVSPGKKNKKTQA